MTGTVDVRFRKHLVRSYDSENIVIGIRAENMETLAQSAADALKVSTHPTAAIEPDMDVWLRFPADKLRWIDCKNGKVLYPA